jgi:hypothetical protein
MKVHLSEPSKVYGNLSEAYSSWVADDIILGEQRACDGLMMLDKHRKYLTGDASKVTCKHCKRKAN